MAIEVGTITNGTVIRIAEYGAIVRLSEGGVGLVHISEIADTYVRDVREHLSENDPVKVKVVGINDKGRYELSVKRAADPGAIQRTPAAVGAAAGPHREPVAARAFVQPRHNSRPPGTFEDRLSRFLKDSDERQGELKRHLDGKRGRR